MLQSIQKRYGEKLRATDGEIGHVKDFYFDDKSWTVRYLVADTGGWLLGRWVLIPIQALGHLYPEGKVLLVNLTREQIEDSPSIDEHKPLSRQHEEEFHRHYGYPYYAESWPLWGLAGYPVVAPPPPEADAEKRRVDSHLRSAREVGGYKVEAGDGVIGEVIDFLVDGRTWGIREIAIECGHWYAGKKIVVSTERVSRIDYDQSTVYLDSTKRAMMDASESRPGIEHDDALQPNARNHDATVENRINIVESTIETARNIPGETKAELLKQVAGLKSEIKALSETHPEEALSISRFADASAHESARSQKNEQLAETALHGLRLSIQGFEESHPRLVETVNRFATTLANIGL